MQWDPARLASIIDGPSSSFAPGVRLSSLCEFLADESRLLVCVRPAVSQIDADMALAWGLALRGDRQLSVMLPVQLAEPTLLRAPWFVPSGKVFTYATDGDVAEPAPLTHEQSIRAYRRASHHASADLGGKKDWIRPLVDWVDGLRDVERIVRSNYVAWHVHGRQVLKVTPSAAGLSIVAGVDAKGEFLGRSSVKVRLNSPADDATVLELIAAVALAAADRLRGADAGHREHQLQARLNGADLGLSKLLREFPAWRPGSDRAAFIDFLGKDNRGRPHVVETKIGPDTMLAFQGLDYWLWCCANRDQVQQALETDSEASPVISFVVAPKDKRGEVISAYTAAHVEALHRTIPWRFVTLSDAATATVKHCYPFFEVPDEVPRIAGTPQRWAVRLRHHATHEAVAAGASLAHGHTHADPSAALVPAARSAYDALRSSGLLHDRVGHVLSSQAFALNLLAPLTTASWTAIARHQLGVDNCEVVEPPQFEFTDLADSLGEATAASPHVTQTDCLVKVRLADGGTHLLLIEVKLTEDEFSTCSAYQSPSNSRRHICSQPGPFGGDADGCFQLCNHDREHRRNYDIALALPTIRPEGLGCWFRDGANQVMRNVALARALMQRGEANSASMLLMAPDDHTTIWEQWRRHTATLAEVEGVQFGALPASQIIPHHEPETARQLARRYLLPADLIELRIAQSQADERFPHGVVLTRIHPDGSRGYQQPIERLVVTAVTTTHVTVETPYPAGPFTHHIAQADWRQSGDLTIPDDEGGARICSADHSHLTADLRKQLHAAAASMRTSSPWWTAPVPTCIP